MLASEAAPPLRLGGCRRPDRCGRRRRQLRGTGGGGPSRSSPLLEVVNSRYSQSGGLHLLGAKLERPASPCLIALRVDVLCLPAACKRACASHGVRHWVRSPAAHGPSLACPARAVADRRSAQRPCIAAVRGSITLLASGLTQQDPLTGRARAAWRQRACSSTSTGGHAPPVVAGGLCVSGQWRSRSVHTREPLCEMNAAAGRQGVEACLTAPLSFAACRLCSFQL